MSEAIYIAVPCHDRRNIVKACLPTILAGMAPEDVMIAYDDGSAQYGPTFLEQWASIAVREPRAIGIEAQRKNHFRAFWQSPHEFLYLTDSDALHDPGWREQAMKLHAEHGGAPICLYDTEAHSGMIGNTIDDNPDSNVIWRRVAPGISYFLSRQHVAGFIKQIDIMEHWDWQVPAFLNHRMAVSRVSYVDHIGIGGMHHPPGVGVDGGDRARNPTPWLVKKRQQAIRSLA